MTVQPTEIGVVILAFGEERYLHQAVDAVLASTGVRVELILVDNGCTSDAVRTLPDDPRLTILTPGRNLGFAGGVNRGAAHLTTPVLALVNSDAVVAPDALTELARALAEPRTGLVSGLVRLADDPSRVNSVGNPLHVLGLSWAGHMGEPVTDHAERKPVASVSGACMAVRREVWDALGGFPDTYFAYLEDLELSWRCWQRGLRVEYVPTAVADHHYEFSRSPLKMYLVERNRLVFLATCYERRTLLLLAPALVAFELALLLVALRQGWARQKVHGWRWVVAHRTWIRRRRREIQAARHVPDRDLVPLITDRFDPAQFPLPPGGGLAEGALRTYWRLVRRLL